MNLGNVHENIPRVYFSCVVRSLRHCVLPRLPMFASPMLPRSEMVYAAQPFALFMHSQQTSCPHCQRIAAQIGLLGCACGDRRGPAFLPARSLATLGQPPSVLFAPSLGSKQLTTPQPIALSFAWSMPRQPPTFPSVFSLRSLHHLCILLLEPGADPLRMLEPLLCAICHASLLLRLPRKR